MIFFVAIFIIKLGIEFENLEAKKEFIDRFFCYVKFLKKKKKGKTTTFLMDF